jgi:hypothetical protein
MRSIAAAFIMICSVGYSHAADNNDKTTTHAHAPFIIQMHTEIVEPCTINFDNPRIAMAWVELASGTLSADQFLEIAGHVMGDIPVEKLAKMKETIKACITGNDL